MVPCPLHQDASKDKTETWSLSEGNQSSPWCPKPKSESEQGGSKELIPVPLPPLYPIITSSFTTKAYRRVRPSHIPTAES